MGRERRGAARFAWNWGLAKCQERYAGEGKWYSAADLHRLWNAQKKAAPALAWWAQNSKRSYQEAFRDLDRALRDFTASRTGKRKGRRLGFPQFKKRGRGKDSFRFSTGAMRCAGSTVTLPRLGTIGTHEGVDLGIKTLLTGADDRGTVVTAEDLNVTGMTRNRRLARAISDQGFGQARRMLGCKTAWNGGTLILADRWYPSSKTCSGCGAVKTKLALSERTYHCDHCGLDLDRDVNAARNLLSLPPVGRRAKTPAEAA